MPTLHPSLIVHSIPYLSHLTTCISLNTVCCHTASPAPPAGEAFCQQQGQVPGGFSHSWGCSHLLAPVCDAGTAYPAAWIRTNIHMDPCQLRVRFRGLLPGRDVRGTSCRLDISLPPGDGGVCAPGCYLVCVRTLVCTLCEQKCSGGMGSSQRRVTLLGHAKLMELLLGLSAMQAGACHLSSHACMHPRLPTSTLPAPCPGQTGA